MIKSLRQFQFLRSKFVAMIAVGWLLFQSPAAWADPADRLTFSGSFILAPQYGIMSGQDRQLLFNYRGRLQATAQIVPKEVALIMAIEGGDGSVFMGDTVFTRELVNTIANDADQNNIANRPTLHFQKAHFYFNPLKETNRTGKLELVVGLFDQFEHLPPNEFGDVGFATSNFLLYEEKGFISCGFCIADVVTADLVGVTATVVGAAGRYQLPNLPVVVEAALMSTEAGNLARTGQTNQRLFAGARAGCVVGSTPEACSDDFQSLLLQVVFAPKLFGYQSHFGALGGGVRNGVVEDHIGKSGGLWLDQFLPGNLIGFAQYQRAEKTPVNFAVTGNKEVVTAGLGWYSDGFPFIAKNYVAFGYNRVATFSNVATGFGPTGDVPEYENWFEVFWRHQWAPGFEVTPHLTVVTNPGGTDQKTLYMPSFRMVAFF